MLFTQTTRSFLVNERFAYNIKHVKTYKGANCDAGHFLVISKLRIKLKTTSRNLIQEIIKYDVEKLKNNRECGEFQKICWK